MLRLPNSLIYQSPVFLDFLCNILGARNDSVVLCSEDGAVRGGIPLLTLEGPKGMVVNSLPFFGSNGGIIAEDPGAASILNDWYNTFAKGTNIASSTLVSGPFDTESFYRGVAHNRTDSRIGQFSHIGFGQDFETLMRGFHYKTRNMIRKAEKSGVNVSKDNDAIAFLRDVHHENLAVLGGIPKPDSFFDLLPESFHTDSDYRIYVANLNGQRVAALLLFYFNQTVEYFMPVIQKDFRDSQPMSLLIYTAMCDASRNGFSRWNWGGTWHTQEGVYRFKSRWGTSDHPYTYYTQLNNAEFQQMPRSDILRTYPYFYVLPFTPSNH